MSEEHITRIEPKLSKWEEWRSVVNFILLILFTSWLFWNWRASQPYASIVILSIGLLSDLGSLVSRISTIITGQYSSGLFLVGWVLYLWAWLSYPDSIILDSTDSLLYLWLTKAVDLIAMTFLHLLINIRFEPEPNP